MKKNNLRTGVIYVGDKQVIERKEIPCNLPVNEYLKLKTKYVDEIVSSRRELKLWFDKYKEALGQLRTLKRRLNDSEERLVEVFDKLNK